MILENLRQELKQLKEFGALRSLTLSVLDRAYVSQHNRKLVNFSSWDYLALANHPAIIKATVQELENSGLGLFAARTTTGTTNTHILCEQLIAQFFQQPQSIVFSSRNQALWSLLTVLLNEQDVIIFDERGDTPLADIASLVGAKAVGAAGSIKDLEKQLLDLSAARRRILYVEGLSSTLGELAQVAELLAVCARTGSELIVDESFAVGAIGLRGSGASDLYSAEVSSLVARKPLCIVADLGRTLAGIGASVSGPIELLELIIARSSTLAREPALPCPTLAAFRTALALVELMHEARVMIAHSARILSEGLVEMKLREHATSLPIVSIILPKLSLANQFARALLEKGIYVEALADALTRSQQGIIRFVVRAVHDEKTIKITLQAISEVVAKLKV